MKRLFDIFFSFVGLLLLSILLIVAVIAVTIVTGKNGIFAQERIGRDGKIFKIFKIRTITFNAKGDKIISGLGSFMRRHKIDELPQLYNVLIGDMSFVGPRPDVSGYYDKLQGDDRLLLKLRPGITGPASLKYANEEQLLANVINPQRYNDEVIFPDKVRINLKYLKKQSMILDIRIIVATIFKREASDF